MELPPKPDDLSACTLCVPAHPLYLAVIGAVVKWFGEQAGLAGGQCSDLEVAVDEACTNVIRHAFPQDGAGSLSVTCSPLADGMSVTVGDRGKRFNPEDGIEIGKRKREENPASGGMGLFMIHELTDDVHYEWDEDKGNQLTLVKRTKEN